jgi:adenylate kinase
MLGAPGSGKGTQAAILAERLGVPAISTGDMLRAAVAAGNELGRRVDDIMSSGALVDDATMEAVVRERLAHSDARHGFLLDGYPRTLDQARALERILGERGERLGDVLLIDVPEAELVARALARKRTDDREEVIRERLRVYREKTAPLIGYYRERRLLAEVDGHQPIERVTSALLSALEAGV